MVRSQIHSLITGAIREKFGGVIMPEFSVSPSENPEHGDYATNAALVLAKVVKKNPMEIAGAIASSLDLHPFAFSKVAVAPPGFINFRLSDGILHEEFNKIFNKKLLRLNLDNIGCEKINIEFISANPTGPLTLGNGRGAFLGDVLSRILKFAGHRVACEYYINDARASTQIQELGRAILRKGDAYPGSVTDEVRERLKKKYLTLEKMNEDDVGYCAAQEMQKDNRAFIEKVLKIKFNKWYSEEKLYRNRFVKKLVKELEERGALYEKDGALWFRASQFGDSQDRVALRTGGAATYFLPDVAYHREKLTKRKFDRVIDIWGADHHGTLPRLLAGLKALGLDAEKVHTIFIQIVRLTRGGKEVRMSKRKGEYVTLEALVKEVGLDAARYFFLEKSSDTHMDFDLDLAKERSAKNPVYYIQYAHARIASILHKARNGGSRAYRLPRATPSLLKEKEETDLIKKLIQFPEIVEDAARDYQVHRLPRYAFELARLFHDFYERHRVITEDKELTEARLALIAGTQIVLKNVLGLMGIDSPDKM